MHMCIVFNIDGTQRYDSTGHTYVWRIVQENLLLRPDCERPTCIWSASDNKEFSKRFHAIVCIWKVTAKDVLEAIYIDKEYECHQDVSILRGFLRRFINESNERGEQSG